MPQAPIVLSDHQVQEVETLAALLNQEQIADYLGISRTTFKAICKRDEEVAVRYKRGKARAIAHVANGLLQKARAGDTVSQIFYLKTQAGWREVAREEDDVGVPDAETRDAARELEAFIERIAGRQRETAGLAAREPSGAEPHGIALGGAGEDRG